MYVFILIAVKNNLLCSCFVELYTVHFVLVIIKLVNVTSLELRLMLESVPQ